MVKPRFGRGSRDVMLLRRPARSWPSALRQVPDPIVQTQLAGREFTCDALVDRDGAIVASPRAGARRREAGISVKGTTFEDAEVTNVVGRALQAVGLTGPANVQGFVAEDGGVAVVEINPRFSGGLPLTLAAGADVVERVPARLMGPPCARNGCRAPGRDG